MLLLIRPPPIPAPNTSTPGIIIGFSKFYLRYIDDIFIIWTRTKEEFLQKISNFHPASSFEYKI